MGILISGKMVFILKWAPGMTAVLLGAINSIPLPLFQLLWLLQDEIASAMRLLTPVTPETLDMVAMHVKSSVEKPRCIAEELRLQFVYGAERSLQPFIEVGQGPLLLAQINFNSLTPGRFYWNFL